MVVATALLLISFWFLSDGVWLENEIQKYWNEKKTIYGNFVLYTRDVEKVHELYDKRSASYTLGGILFLAGLILMGESIASAFANFGKKESLNESDASSVSN